jgi:hypothetical protein
MAIRVTQTFLRVLHTGKTQLDGSLTGNYDHAYEAYDMSVVASWDVEIGQTLEARTFTSSYFLAGFEQFENAVFNAQSDIAAYEASGGQVSGNYTLNAYELIDGRLTGEYQLEAYVELTGEQFGHYDLNTFEPADVVLNSEYDLQAYLLQQGFATGMYDVEVYTDLLMNLVGTYDYLTFEQQDQNVLTGAYDLNAWEAQEQAMIGYYALNTFLASTSYLDTAATIEVYEALQLRYGIHYDLEALLALTNSLNGRYQVLTYAQAEQKIGASYDLLVYEALNGFVDGHSALNTFQAANAEFGVHYGIAVYVAANGFLDGTHDLETLLALTGYSDATYLLDTTQVLYTWVVNQNTGAPGRYENYDFDAFAKLGESYLGARGDAIYLLDGDDDAGADIDAIATIGLTDLEEPHLKRVTAAYLGVSSSGQIHLTLTTDQAQVSGPYELRQPSVGSKTERSKFKRGIKSRYWQVDIENADGDDVKIDGLELETEVVGRRLKK